MSETEMEEYIERQEKIFNSQQIFTTFKPEEDKQIQFRQDAYNQLLKDHHALQDKFKKTEEERVRISGLLEEYQRVLDMYEERIIPIPLSTLKSMYLLSKDPDGTLYVCLDAHEKVLWVKSEDAIKKEREREK